MNTKTKTRVIAILAVWLLGIGWHLRWLRNWGGSPLPRGYSVNIDATRYFILEHGHVTRPETYTTLSGYVGAQNYDIAAIFMASMNIVTGKVELMESIHLLQLTQFTGLVLFPAAFLYWFQVVKEYDHTSNRTSGIVLTLALVLFPSASLIAHSSKVWHTKSIAMAIMVFTVASLPKIRRSRRFRLLFVVFVVTMINLYHTWVQLFLLLVGGALVGQAVLARAIDGRSFQHYIVSTLLLCVVFFTIGWYLNSRFYELVYQLSLAFRTEHTFLAATLADSTLSGSRGSSGFSVMHGARLANYGLSLVVVGFFSALIGYRYVRSRSLPGSHRTFIFVSLALFPAVFGLYFTMGGFERAVGRTQVIGSFYLIFAGVILLRDHNRRVRLASSVVVVLIVVSAVVGAVPGLASPPHTYQEEKAIEYVGTNAPRQQYIFSTTSLGTPLQYYGHPGIVAVTGTYPDWEKAIQTIYYENDSEASLVSMREVINFYRFEDTPSPDRFQVLLSSAPQTDGVSALMFNTRPTVSDPREKFVVEPRASKTYTTGEVTLFRVSGQ